MSVITNSQYSIIDKDKMDTMNWFDAKVYVDLRFSVSTESEV